MSSEHNIRRERSKMSSSSPVRFLGLIAVCFAFLLASYSNTMTLGSQSDRDQQQQPTEQEEVEDVMEGGVRDVEGFENDAEYAQLARFAVDEHNKKQNATLEFVRLVKAKEQVVAGVMHHLTVEVKEAGKKKLYEAKVWVQAWLNSKQLHEFNPLGDSSSTITPADLGAKRDGHESGWRTVPPHDPVVKDAAHHALKTIQQRSNSLAPYELLEILLAKAEVIEDLAKFDLLLKLKRGSKEEKYKVEVHKNLEGTFHLNQMQVQL